MGYTIPGATGGTTPSYLDTENLDAKRAKEQLRAAAAGVTKEDAPETTKATPTDLTSNQAAAARSLDTSGNDTQTLSSGLMAAGSIPSAASPYLLAGGVVTGMMGASEAADRRKEEADALRDERDEDRRISAQNTLINTLQAYGSGIVV